MKRLPAGCVTLLFAAVAIAQIFPVAHAAVTTTATSSPQSQVEANSQQIADLNQKIAAYQAELQKVGADKKTLQVAINALNLQRSEVQAQVALTQLQINTTQGQIQQLGGEIVKTKQDITSNQAALGRYLRSLQETEDKPLMVQLLSSGGLAETWDAVNATLEMEDAVQRQMQTLRTQENSLASSQTASKQKQGTLASQKQILASQQQSLTATEQSKNQLLAQTKSQESAYQKLLAQAEAELNSFSTFTQNAGGSKLLANQTSCDSWGCYYNQRDAAWGSNSLDGTKYTLANAGCLVAAMAMVLTHYGYRDVTPATINSDPNNFAAYSQDLLLATISVDGVSATRKIAALDAILATGHPAIVGLRADGGTHFVVFVSGRKGDYIMRDPYIANGKDISFSAHYSLKDIFSSAKVVISG